MDRTRQSLARIEVSPQLVLLAVALTIGSVTGSGVVLFRYAIEWVRDVGYGGIGPALKGWGVSPFIPIPILGGLIIGALRAYLGDFGPGVAGIIGKTTEGKKLSLRRGILKTAAAAISLGTGASLGPEGPSVEIGALGSAFLGQLLKVSQERQQLLVGAGAAAGVAAGFNAPIAGVFFALEVVLGTAFATESVSIVLLAAVVSSLVAQVGLGAKPAFTLPNYDVQSPWELPLYFLLGAIASLVAFAFVNLNRWLRQVFDGEVAVIAWFGKLPVWLKPVIGGTIVGLVAGKFPQVAGIGYESIEAILQGVAFSDYQLSILLILKLVLTSISLSSGLVGGIFAPSIFIGAVLGAGYANFLPHIFPWLDSQMASPPAYAMVGMAALLASSARAPLTAILLLFELTRDYQIVLPLMACVGFSYWWLDRLSPPPNPAEKLDRAAIDVPVDETSLILPELTVADVMEPPMPQLPPEMTIVAAASHLAATAEHSALIVDRTNRLHGIITISDLQRTFDNLANNEATFAQWQPKPIVTLCNDRLITIHPDEPATLAIEKMSARGLHQIPVISRDSPQTAIGIVRRDRIPSICRTIVMRQSLAKLTMETAE
jgi:H+/Cl- antiporter ClcA/predicted transcriptional regulator